MMLSSKEKSMQQGQELQLTLPLPPSHSEAYHYASRFHSGCFSVQPLPSAALIAYQRKVARIFTEQDVNPEEWNRVKAVGYTVYLYVPTRAMELSNRLEVLEAVVLSALGVPKSRVEEIHPYKRLDEEHPRVEMTVYRVVPTQKIKKAS